MQNDFLAFATGGDANVLDQTDYAAAAQVETGFQAGIASSALANKIWRQSSFVMAAIAQFIQNQMAVDVLDDGNLANLVANLTAAVQTGAAIKPARIVAASAALNIAVGDYAIGFDRVAAPAEMSAQLPAGAQVGQEFVLEDLAGNFSAYPITVLPPAGDSIASEPSFTMGVDGKSYKFRKYGAAPGPYIWSVA